MVKCKYYIPAEKGCRENCTNCKRWNGERCRDEKLLRERYEDSDEFKVFDSLMRNNKPVTLPS